MTVSTSANPRTLAALSNLREISDPSLVMDTNRGGCPQDGPEENVTSDGTPRYIGKFRTVKPWMLNPVPQKVAHSEASPPAATLPTQLAPR